MTKKDIDQLAQRGTYSIWLGKDDIKYLKKLGWQNIGISKLFSRSLKFACKYFNLRKKYIEKLNLSIERLEREKSDWE